MDTEINQEFSKIALDDSNPNDSNEFTTTLPPESPNLRQRKANSSAEEAEDAFEKFKALEEAVKPSFDMTLAKLVIFAILIGGFLFILQGEFNIFSAFRSFFDSVYDGAIQLYQGLLKGIKWTEDTFDDYLEVKYSPVEDQRVN